MKKRILPFILCGIMLLTTPIFATENEQPIDMTNAGLENIVEETSTDAPADGNSMLGVDENGNTIDINANQDITIDTSEINKEINETTNPDSNMSIDEEMPDFSIEVEEDYDPSKDKNNTTIDTNTITPIVSDLDEEIVYADGTQPQDLNTSAGNTTIIIVIGILVVVGVVCGVVFSKKKKNN